MTSYRTDRIFGTKSGFSRCLVDGCEKSVRHGHRLCEMHKARLYRHGSTGTASEPGGITKLTAEQCADIRRRLSKFHKPVDIARDFRVSMNTVRKVSRGEYVPVKQDAPDPGAGQQRVEGVS